MRAVWILIALALQAAGGTAPAPFVEAVEFPPERVPRANWERELVWLKNIGIRDVAANAAPPELIRILRRLEMRVWLPPGSAAEKDLAAHGGPVVWIDGSSQPLVRVAASDSAALWRSRSAIASGRGMLLWTGVEDTLAPGGVFQKGEVSFNGNERAGAAVVRREAALARSWLPWIGGARPHPVRGRMPEGVRASALVSASGAAVSLLNQSSMPFLGPLRVGKLSIPAAKALPGEAVWMPLDLSLAASGLCADCGVFAPGERIVYATAELRGVEYENGILAMEFRAPEEAEVLVRLTQRPSGPLIAGGRPRDFDWDEAASTARIVIPAGKAPGFDVRVGIAIAPPESSGFFTGEKVLVLGRANRIRAQFSSEALAGRSRLLAPPHFQIKAEAGADAGIEYEVTPPSDALHGERVEFALEADGVRLGRARLQLLRPVSVRWPDRVHLHFGADGAIEAAPPLIAGAGEVRAVIRNNDVSIRSYVLEARCPGVEMLPGRMEIAVGASADREITLRAVGESGLHACTLTVEGASQAFRLALVKRGEAIAYRTDFDADGRDEWVVENQKLRAVFSAGDGGRWLEFVNKETGRNALPVPGAHKGTGDVEVSASSGREASLRIAGKGWKRSILLRGGDSYLSMEQDSPFPPDSLVTGPQGPVMLGVARPAPNRAVYLLDRLSEEEFAGAMGKLLVGK